MNPIHTIFQAILNLFFKILKHLQILNITYFLKYFFRRLYKHSETSVLTRRYGYVWKHYIKLNTWIYWADNKYSYDLEVNQTFHGPSIGIFFFGEDHFLCMTPKRNSKIQKTQHCLFHWIFFDFQIKCFFVCIYCKILHNWEAIH